MNSLVSIIIVTRNRAHVLLRALESLQAQAYYCWEAIVVDDFSEDATWRCVSYSYDDRIHYIRTDEHIGLASARNLGLSYASGAIIAYLDDDNQYYPGALKAIAEMPSRATWGACYRNITLMKLESGRIVARNRGNSANRPITRTRILGLETTIDSNCLFHRPEILQAVGGWPGTVDEPGFEDTLLIGQLALDSFSEFWLLPQVLVDYQTTLGDQGEGQWGRLGYAGQIKFLKIWLKHYGAHLTNDQRAKIEEKLAGYVHNQQEGISFSNQWFASGNDF